MVSFVDNLGLQDPPLLGSSFTYFSSGSSGARSRHDHFLISCEAGGWSHNVIRVEFNFSNGQSSLGPKSFKFFNIWCQDDKFRNLVSKV